MKSAPPETCSEALARMSVIADRELSQTLEMRANGPTKDLYNMLRYFMGYLDEKGEPIAGKSGKRFRPSLSLLVADAYGARDMALEAAVAIELFHNFSLIHDDVEDHDEYRRNRPTVWKLWGINHAINSGDVQSLIASEWIVRAAQHADVGAPLAKLLVQAFIEVGEGQYLDFELTDVSLGDTAVSEERYLLMIEKKSGALVRASVEAGGVAAGKDDAERALLREYGLSLGMAYQIADDYRSLWATQAQTGKDALGDIREHKRTLPFLYAYTEVVGDMRDRLRDLYSLSRQLVDEEIHEALQIIEKTGAKTKTLTILRSYVDHAKAAGEALALPEEAREILLGTIDLLVPEVGGR